MRAFLDSFPSAEPWLRGAGFADPLAAHRNFVALADQGLPLDLLSALHRELTDILPVCADPDMALNNFERMTRAVRSPLSILTFLLRKPPSPLVLFQLLSASQYFSDVLVANPEYFDFLWEAGHEPFDRQALQEDLMGELRSADYDEQWAMTRIRQCRQRELLRIGYRDIILGEPLQRIVESISDLADCLVEVALDVALRKHLRRFGQPREQGGSPARLAILAMGKLGGRELNYSSDIDLVAIHSHEGRTDGPQRMANGDFFAHVLQDLIRLLAANTPMGQAYRVDLRLRPFGKQGPLVLSLHNTLAYYDQHGRTWERQALVKVRPIAGDRALGEEFLAAIEPFVYRRYLSHFEINEIKAIKRRIEANTRDTGGEETDLKTGHGGIRDIEFVTQFLQLVHGGTLPAVRQRNTQQALAQLARTGCINQDEHAALQTAYEFLRKAEHRLQFLFDLQTHRIPESAGPLDKLARRLGYGAGGVTSPGQRFLADLRTATQRNRSILERFMHDLFPQERSRQGEPETDLVLDPDPGAETIDRVLGAYRFAEVRGAYKNLLELAREEVPFLSSVRCRHFLASLAPQLLRAIAEAPDPDMALLNLERVTRSLGAKGVLWESLSVNPPLLRLYVHLCSWSQFLSGILIKNPGMIDELLDTLSVDRDPSLGEVTDELRQLLRGAREIEPILHGFRNTHLLRIGVHDILRQRSLATTCRQQSELAQAILGAITERHWMEMAAQYGLPALGGDPSRSSLFVLLGLGKFGGWELTYHSDLDLILIYDGVGKTVARPLDGERASGPADRSQPTRGTVTNREFYTELAQRIIRTISQSGPMGQLYAVDLRLRPAGQSGNLVLPLERFERYYLGGGAELWERQALTRARVVHGDRELGGRVLCAIRAAISQGSARPDFAQEVHRMRCRLAASRAPNDLKRRPGGIMDVEFAVQMAQIEHGSRHPEIIEPNLWDALDRIEQAGLWPPERVARLRQGYTFLRTVESRLRIVHDSSRDSLPDDPRDLDKLAARLGYEVPQPAAQLESDIQRHTAAIRQEYLACLADHGYSP